MNNNNPLSQKDLMNASLLFSKALSLILDNMQGIVVDVNPDSGVDMGENTNKVVIYRLDNQIHVQNLEMDIQEGTVVALSDKDNNENSENV
jgi:hypothetical protein